MAQQVYSFVLESDPNQVLQLRVSEAWIGPHVEGKDATFKVVPGLVESKDGTISFESTTNQGFYLRHAYGKLWLDSNDELSRTFSYDASFKPHPGLDGHGQSFEASNYPENYITILNGRVSLTRSSGTDDFKRNSSWKEISHPTPAGGQSGWCFCTKCSTLVYSKGADLGHCSQIWGGPHTFTGSYYVSINHALVPGEQGGWAWCVNCQSFWYSLLNSICAWGGGKHSTAYSAPYFVPCQIQPPSSEPGWRFCNQCANLWREEGGEAICLHGGKHVGTDPGVSYSYAVYKN